MISDSRLEEVIEGEDGTVLVPWSEFREIARELYLHRALADSVTYNPMAVLQDMIQQTGAKVAGVLLPGLGKERVSVLIARPLNLLPEELEELLLHQIAFKNGMESVIHATAMEIKGKNPYTPVKEGTKERGN